MKVSKILILEDDLKTLSVLLNKLSSVFVHKEGGAEAEKVEFSVTVISDCDKVDKFINKMNKGEFDIILLDRDCSLGGSFHLLDIPKFGAKKVIAISSVPEFNQELKEKYGIDAIIEKDFEKLDNFADRVTVIIKQMLRNRPQ